MEKVVVKKATSGKPASCLSIRALAFSSAHQTHTSGNDYQLIPTFATKTINYLSM